MRKGLKFTALATTALLLGAGAAYADPYADEALSVDRATGFFSNLEFTHWDGNLTGGRDRGNEALGAPNLDTTQQFDRVTILGYDDLTGLGGNAVLAFRDNMCLASDLESTATDIKVYDQFGGQSDVGDESATVEVSNDGGETFVLIGEVGPGLGAGATQNFELKAAGAMDYFNVVRVTATDTDPYVGIRGMDLDAVQCLNSVEAPYFDYNLDRCEYVNGHDERDVESVMVRTDGTQVVVEMTLCADLMFDKKGKSTYTVNFDVNSPTVLEGNAACDDTSDFAATYKQDGSQSGVDDATFEVNGNRLTATLPYGDLLSGDEFLVWVTTSAAGGGAPATDSVPNVEAGDRCSEPQRASEVMSVTAM